MAISPRPVVSGRCFGLDSISESMGIYALTTSYESGIVNQRQHQLEHEWRRFTRVAINAPIVAELRDLDVEKRLAILEAFATRDRLQARVRGKFGGIGARQTRSYRGASIPFVDGSTRFMLPRSPFKLVRRLLSKFNRRRL